MAGFGENLRREREMRRVSLKEISETTKISVRFLDALENEEFSKLPGGIFIRSFIRAYANYLGLDADSVVAEYELVAPPKDEEDFSKLGVSGTSLRQKRRASILPWIIAVILLGGGYAIFRHTHRSSEMPLTFGNPEADIRSVASGAAHQTQDTHSLAGPQVLVPKPSTAAVPSRGAPATDSAPPMKNELQTSSSNLARQESAPPSPASARREIAGVAGVSESALPPNAGDGPAADPAQDGTSLAPSVASPSLAAAETRGDLVLQVAAHQPSWVAVEADGRTIFERVLAPHNVHTLIAKNYFDVTTGNAQGTILTLNGVTLKPLGRHGEVRKIHLTRTDLKKFTR